MKGETVSKCRHSEAVVLETETIGADGELTCGACELKRLLAEVERLRAMVIAYELQEPAIAREREERKRDWQEQQGKIDRLRSLVGELVAACETFSELFDTDESGAMDDWDALLLKARGAVGE